MSDTPSLMNLDQAKSEINNFVNNNIESAKKELNELNNSNLNNVSNTVNGLAQQFEILKQKIKDSFGNEIFEKLTDELNSVNTRVKDVYNSFNSIIESKATINEFIDSIGLISKAIDEVNKKTADLNNTNIDSGKFEELKNKTIDMKNLFHELITVVNLDDVNPSNYVEIQTQITRFMSDISKVIADTFNISNALKDSVQEEDLLDITRILNTAFSTVPEEFKNNCSDAFKQIQNDNTLKIDIDDSNIDDFLRTYQERLQQQFALNPVGDTAKMDAMLDRLKRSNEVINNNFNDSTNNKMNRIGQSQNQSKEIDNNFKKFKSFSEDMELKLTNLKDKIRSGNISKTEKEALNKSGIKDLSGVEKILSELLRIQKNVNKYSAIKHNISSSLGSYKNAVINNDKSGISQNTKSIMDQTRQVGELISNINSSLNKLSKIPNKNIFDNLPKEMKDLYSSMEDLDNVSKSSSNNVLKLAETFGVALNDNMSKSLKEATKNIKENADSVNQMATNNAGFFNSLSRGLSGIKRIFGSLERTLGGLGLGVGIPMSIGGFMRFNSGITDYYKQFGEMDYQSAKSLYAHGESKVSESILEKNKNIGIKMHKDTYGKINFKDYSNEFNSLLQNVGGHNGNKFSKPQGVKDMSQFARLNVDFKAAFGMDVLPQIKTLYKELNLSAQGTTNSLLSMVGAAQAANIPVKEYVETVTNLALQFKSIGLNASDAENAIRNLTMTGMSLNVAKDIAGGVASGVNKMIGNTAEIGYWSMAAMPGKFDSPFQAKRAVLSDMYDEKGNVRKNSKGLGLSALTEQLKMTVDAAGGMKSDSGWTFAFDYMKNNLGIKDNGAATAMTNAFVSGNMKSFNDLFKKNLAGGNKSQEQKSMEQLEQTIINSSKHIDELTKASELVKVTQMELAKITKGLYDLLGKSFQKLIITLGGSILKLTDIIMKGVNKISQVGGRLAGIGNALVNHPILGTLTLIAGALTGKKLMKMATGKIASKLTGKGIAQTAGKAGILQSFKNFFTKNATKSAGKGVAAVSAKSIAKTGTKAVLKKLPLGIGAVLGTGINIWDSRSNGESWSEALQKGAVGAASGLVSAIPVVGTVAGLGLDWYGTEKIDQKFKSGIYGKSNKTNLKSSGKSNLTKTPDVTDVYSDDNDFNSIYSQNSINNQDFGKIYSDSLYNYSSQFEKMSGVSATSNYNSKLSKNANDSNNKKIYGSLNSKELKMEQEETKQSIKDMQHSHGILLQNRNALAKESYSLHDSRYSKLIDSATNQLKALINIGHILDSGFTFIDKAIHALYSEISTSTQIIQESLNGMNINGVPELGDSSDNSGLPNNIGGVSNGNNVNGKSLSSGKGTKTLISNSKYFNSKDLNAVSKYDSLIEQAVKGTGVDADAVKAIILEASKGNARFTKGRRMGLMGIDSIIAKDHGVYSPEQLYDPLTNIKTGVKILQELKKPNLIERFTGIPESKKNDYFGAFRYLGERYNTLPLFNSKKREEILKNEIAYSKTLANMMSDLKHNTRAVTTVKPKVIIQNANKALSSPPSPETKSAGEIQEEINQKVQQQTTYKPDEKIKDISYTQKHYNSAQQVNRLSREYKLYNPYYGEPGYHFDSSRFSPKKIGIDNSYIKDAQGMARYLVQDYKRVGERSYAQTLNPKDDTSTSSNYRHFIDAQRRMHRPNERYDINIKIDGSKNKEYEKMAKELQLVVEQYMKDNMDTSMKIAESNYIRYNG